MTWVASPSSIGLHAPPTRLFAHAPGLGHSNDDVVGLRLASRGASRHEPLAVVALGLALGGACFAGRRRPTQSWPSHPSLGGRTSVAVLRRCLSLAAAYAELGLSPGAELAEVRRTFRRLARENHPDVCARERLAEAGARFVAIKRAYDAVLASFGGRSAAAGGDFRQDMSGFIKNMAGGVGHHKVSDGRTYELWLDLRGFPGLLGMAKQEVMKLFWGTRNIVDTLGVSLLKDGVVSGIVTDDHEAADSAGGSLLPEALLAEARAIASWDFDWIPLVLVNGATGRARHAATGAPLGCLRAASRGKLLDATAETAGPEDGFDALGASSEEELLVAAADAWETEQAQARYGFVMSALLLPPDPTAWSVASVRGVTADEVAETFIRIKGGKKR